VTSPDLTTLYPWASSGRAHPTRQQFDNKAVDIILIYLQRRRAESQGYLAFEAKLQSFAL